MVCGGCGKKYPGGSGVGGRSLGRASPTIVGRYRPPGVRRIVHPTPHPTKPNPVQIKNTISELDTSNEEVIVIDGKET